MPGNEKIQEDCIETSEREKAGVGRGQATGAGSSGFYKARRT